MEIENPTLPSKSFRGVGLLGLSIAAKRFVTSLTIHPSFPNHNVVVTMTIKSPLFFDVNFYFSHIISKRPG